MSVCAPGAAPCVRWSSTLRSDRAGAILASTGRATPQPPRDPASSGATCRRTVSCPWRKYSPPGTISGVSNDSRDDLGPDVAAVSRRRGISSSNSVAPLRLATGQCAVLVQRVVARHAGRPSCFRLEHPSRLRTEENRRVGLEVAPHGFAMEWWSYGSCDRPSLRR